MIKRRRVLTALAALPLTPAPNVLAKPADAYPSKPLHIIVTFPAGGPTDIVARIIANKLGPRIGQTVIVENKGGAAGNIGVQAAVAAAPDGHTIVLVAPTVAVNPSLYKLPFDVLVDLAPVTQHVSLQYMLVVNRNLPANNVTELIALAKTREKPLSYGTWGVGSHAQLCAVQLESMVGIKMIHVPYRGSAPAMTDVVGGQVDLMFDSVATAIPHVRAGNVRALAVTGLQRAASMSDVPPMSESVPGYEMTGWQAFMAPGKTPRRFIDYINQELTIVLRDPEVATRLNDLGLSVVASSPDDFGKFLKAEHQKYAELIRTANISLN